MPKLSLRPLEYYLSKHLLNTFPNPFFPFSLERDQLFHLIHMLTKTPVFEEKRSRFLKDHGVLFISIQLRVSYIMKVNRQRLAKEASVNLWPSAH